MTKTSRLTELFQRLRAARRLALITYVTAGDPDLIQSAEILRALDRSGADVIEVGVPFSDPIADGPIIQRASQRALAAGGSLAATLELIRTMRAELAAPVVLFSYVNPILCMGMSRFVSGATAAGVDGVLVLDLPLEEADPLAQALNANGLDTILLVSPTTSEERIRRTASIASGFLYCISRLGVTGSKETLDAELPAVIGRIRAITPMPVAVGFGLSRPDHLAAVARWADAAVVGSALIQVIAEATSPDDRIRQVENYLAWLRGGLVPVEPVSRVEL